VDRGKGWIVGRVDRKKGGSWDGWIVGRGGSWEGWIVRRVHRKKGASWEGVDRGKGWIVGRVDRERVARENDYYISIRITSPAESADHSGLDSRHAVPPPLWRWDCIHTLLL
jgi:hypothetical protein